MENGKMIEIEFNKTIFDKYWKNINAATDLRTFNLLIPLNYILEKMIESLHLYATFVGVIDIQINPNDTVTITYTYQDYSTVKLKTNEITVNLVVFEDGNEELYRIK